MTDSVVPRHGLVQADLSCARTALTANIAASDTQLTVDPTASFAAGTRIHIPDPKLIRTSKTTRVPPCPSISA